MANQYVDLLGDITAADALYLYARQSGGPQGRLRLDALRTFYGTDNLAALSNKATARTNLGLPAVRTPDALNIVTTGGTGALVVAAGSGFPGAEALGLSVNAAGSVWLRYRIVDRSGGLLEGGRGLFVVSTRTLTRSVIRWTGSGSSTLVHASAGSAPAAVNVPVGAEVQFFMDIREDVIFSAGADGFGTLSPLMTGGLAGATAFTKDTLYFVPFPWPGGSWSTITLYIATSPGASLVIWGVYDSLANNKPGSLIHTGASVDTSATGIRSITNGVKTRGAELLWLGLDASAVGIYPFAFTQAVPGPQGTYAAVPLTAYSASFTFGALPSTAPTTLTGIYNWAPAVWLLAAN